MHTTRRDTAMQTSSRHGQQGSAISGTTATARMAANEGCNGRMIASTLPGNG